VCVCVCVCVCVRVRVRARACVCVCVRARAQRVVGPEQYVTEAGWPTVTNYRVVCITGNRVVNCDTLRICFALRLKLRATR
jgi:hypothetical protein